jgi:predicted exporter
MKQSVWIACYRYFAAHRKTCFALLAVVFLGLVALALRLQYQEDITDFLPFDTTYKTATTAYQESATQNRVVVIAQTQLPQVDSLIQATHAYFTLLQQNDTLHQIAHFQEQVDMEAYSQLLPMVYERVPYYLTPADYARIDSLLCDTTLVTKQLTYWRNQLMLPGASFSAQVFASDPLGLFTPVLTRLGAYQPQTAFQIIDGYLFSPDNKQLIAFVESPYGGSETANNQQLVNLLEDTRLQLQQTGQWANVDIRFIGSPVIAVTNANQIKQDSLLAMVVSLSLIILLLYKVFKNVRSLALIAGATLFGFVFAMAFIGLIKAHVSFIVLGISSIIIGIAVNYPLHYLYHLKHQNATGFGHEQTLRHLITPLLIGNITTIGAFLTLVPLQANALQDLGIFCAGMLVGTMLFVLLFLPHLTGKKAVVSEHDINSKGLVWLSDILQKVQNHRLTLPVIVLLTVVLGYFSLQVEFDANMSHINYMTAQQRTDLAHLHSLTQTNTQYQTVYVLAKENTQALHALEPLLDSLQATGSVVSYASPTHFLPAQAVQQERLSRWQTLQQDPRLQRALAMLPQQAEALGFAPHCFEPFAQLLKATSFPSIPQTPQGHQDAISLLMTPFFTSQGVLLKAQVPFEQVGAVEQAIEQTHLPVLVFDMQAVTSRIATSLSNNFNYIGTACSIIVFLFLLLSFKKLKIALVAFIPMVVAWIWIMGLMALFHIPFNIVNIILATFIFGQGDDYTIFITEGLIQEKEQGIPVLQSYKGSILLSAIIMLLGIGTLLVASHPAMYSLAQVTIIGMFVVVFMAWVLPPMLYKVLCGKFT